jgi:hypothetical protein
MSALRPSHHRIVSGPDDNFRLSARLLPRLAAGFDVRWAAML